MGALKIGDRVTVAEVVSALANIAYVHADDDNRAHITDYAPDSSDAEYGGDTSPGSAWDDECDRLLADVRDELPIGWAAEWSDDDIRLMKVDQ